MSDAPIVEIRRSILSLGTVAWLVVAAGPAWAGSTLQVYMDVGNDASTGCAAPLEDSGVDENAPGFELRATLSIDTNFDPARVTRVRVRNTRSFWVYSLGQNNVYGMGRFKVQVKFIKSAFEVHLKFILIL